MAGFITNSVELIQRILFDGRKTDELLVLKELVQNADDARAQVLEVGISEGLPHAQHPLLRGQGLYVVNDGPFDARHARAVRSLGGSSKVEEDSAIGKFGIGLKSVFFLGEVFFYLCRSADDDGQPTLPMAQVLNPWNNGEDAENPRQEWDLFTPEDRKSMRAYLDARGVTDGFAIWVPLRTQDSTRLADGELSVYQAYPGDDHELERTLFSQRVYREIARMLPLMRHLRRVQFRAPQGLVTLDVGHSDRSHYPDLVEEHAFAGQVRGEGSPNLQFSVSERLLTSGRIQQLRASHHWPRRQVAGAARQVEDKTRAHTAVAIKRQDDQLREGRPGAPARVQIQWAVFLPLGDTESIAIGGSVNFHITLHGCFFITSDRRDILSWRDAPKTAPESSSQLQQQWNAELARKGTLPLLLPTLAAFSQQLSADEATLLTMGIRMSRVWREHQAELCARGQWVRTLEGEWRLVTLDTRLLAFPRLADAQPGTWLPGWVEIQRQATLVDAGAPHLMAGLPAPWRTEELQLLLGDLHPAAMEPETLEQLSSVFRTIASPSNWPARRLWLSRVLAGETKALQARREGLATLLQTVSAEERFVLPKGLSRQVRERLAPLPISVLMVPGELSVEGQANLPWTDALMVLEALAGQRGTTGAVTQVISAVPVDEQRHLRAAVAQLPLVEVRTLTSKEPRFIAPAEAHAQIARRRLFRATDTTRDWARLVEQAFRDVQVEYTEGAVLEALGGEIQSFEADDVVTLVRQGVPFTDLAGRTRLLNDLLRRNLLDSHRALMRAVLHGRPAHLNRADALLVVRSSQPALERLAGQLLAGRTEDWRVIPKALDDLLNEPQRQLLNVEPLDAAAVAQMIDRESVRQVNAEAFSDTERLELLRHLPIPAARALPFHQTQQGTLVSLTSDTLIPGEAALPQAMQAQVTLLRHDPKWDALWDTLQVQTLSIPVAVRRVLRADTPSEHVAWLLEQLVALDEDGLEQVRTPLTDVEWIPDAGGDFAYAPAEVIYLPGMQDALTRLLQEVESTYVNPAQLPEAVSAHAGFERLIQGGFLFTGEDAVMAVAEVLAGTPDGQYGIGEEELDFETWWGHFSSLGETALPALAFLTPVHALNPDWARRAWEALTGPLPDAALPLMLNRVAELQGKRQGNRETLLRLHASLLTELRARGLWASTRDLLKLRNAKDEWRPVGELCVQAEGVDARDRLHDDHQRQLGDDIAPVDFPETFTQPGLGGKGKPDSSQAPQQLDAYFRSWEGRVPDELIGAFVSLLGGDPSMEAMARRRLHPRSLGVVRDIVEEDAAQRPRNIHSFEEWISLYRVTVQVSSDDHLWVMSLADEPLKVRRDTSRPTVVVGRPEPGRIQGDLYTTALHLNELDVTQYSRVELGEALLTATRAVLRGMYLVREDHLDVLWKELGESDQFDLLYTQDVIIQDSISYIRYQLSLPGQHPLNDLFKRWESARLSEAEEHHNSLVRKKGRATEQIETLRKELQAAFEDEDPDVIPRLLEAVRRRVQDAQYLPASVPFELLQNADDALEELQVMRGGARVDDTFVVESGDGSLTFRHWGRAINQFALPEFDGEVLGFKGDLKKMLMLAASDKGASDLAVTGKFGMGFKSVYLLTDRPEVVSGRLAFEVLGGVYPKQLSAERVTVLRDGLARHGEWQKGTSVALEVDAASAAAALHEFRAWLPVLLVFTRQVKRVIDVTPDGEAVTSWQDLPLGESGWRVGGIHPEQGALGRGLVCELPAGTMLFPLGARGLTPLPADIPTLWVTAPTRSHARAGFAVNATFALDIGRSEVASRSPQNERLAAALGQGLGQALRSLHDQTGNWTGFVQALALAADTTPMMFWHSVWSLLAGQAPDDQGSYAARLVRSMVWGQAEAGLWALLKDREVLPTGLTGDHDVLTSLARVTHELHGVAARDSVFRQFRETVTLNLLHPPGTLLHESVSGRLRELTGGVVDLPKLRLIDILKAEFGAHPEVSHERAIQLAQEYTRAQLATFGTEQDEIQDYLATFRFQTLAGTFVPAQELILAAEHASVSADERRRAAFAPRERVLHPAYQEATEFVFLCRGGLRADARALALWATDARGIEAQRAVVHYLLKGELSAQLADELAQDPGTWLGSILNHVAFRELSSNEQHVLAGQLKLGGAFEAKIRSTPLPAEHPAPVHQVENPGQYLSDLYDDWLDIADDAIRTYEKNTYPDFMQSGGRLLPFDEDRKRWMTLLLLGTYQSLGRTTPQQTRDFLQRAEEQGWLDVFAAPDVDPVAWFRILDGFLSTSPSQEYYHWFSRFLATYQLSRHLDLYMGILTGMDHLKEPQPLTAILNPSSSMLFTGSGIDVPDLQRALGIGRHFVLRELLRTGTLTTRVMDAEAFHPSAAVRRELAALGCPVDPQGWSQGDSRAIYHFIKEHLGEKRATFTGAFDLPFLSQVPVL